MSVNKRYFWLKLKNDFFQQKEIKKLRKIAGGDTYTIIYLKMLLRSLTNNGVLFYEGVEDNFIAELALDIDEDDENVAITVSYLKAQRLLEELSEEEFLLSACPEMVGSETASAQRVRKYRNNKKALQCNINETLPQHQRNTEIEKEIEIDKEIEKEREGEIDKRVNYQLIADMYNDTCVSFPCVKTLSEKRKKAIKARLKVYSVEAFKELFEKAEASSFLKGANGRNWVASFDWLISDGNMAKVLDGNYDDRKKAAAPIKPKFDLSHLEVTHDFVDNGKEYF